MEEKKNSKFVRALIVLLMGFLIWIITYSFLHIEPKGSISTGMITLIILLVLIVLSESFDNFSVAKLFTVTRELESKETSIDKLDKQNTELRRELVNVVTSISQNQSSTNIIGLSDDIAKRIGVEKATEDEITDKRTEETEDTINSSQQTYRRINHQKLEEIAFTKFLRQCNLSEYNLIKEAKLVTQFSGIDAISNIQPIYDGYINTGESEIFVEIKASRGISPLLREQIYLMLNKIYLYNKIKNANAHLNLLLVPLNVGSGADLRNKRHADRIKEFFEPAIVKGLLKIIELEFNEDEIKQSFIEE
ncbi:hypothetical protein [Halarcobacter bivalviorum]|uniref:hypothetical protein n=1 Tax=Halarcobacter bivalviorum TaxID=663364 RepID=UPI00100B652C|nr:hypothetical protein [Halarcobacter bivalviorum]RXK08038.1 hypothetical protein CRU97_01445 [Halarcobacter bivalviorum]